MIGPHEGKELRLMRLAKKPLSMFVDLEKAEGLLFPEKDFDTLVSKGKLVKNVSYESALTPNGKSAELRRIMYALPEHEWRISALLMILDIYNSLQTRWRPDLERVIGALLGYSKQDIEDFIIARGMEPG